MSAREAFKTIGLACLKQAINNEPALIRGDPEGVHQMRVGLRRLRAAMSLFAALLHDPQTAAIKNELKWLAGELGPARELEVLLSRVVAPMKRRHRRWRGMPSLSHELAERRDAALARAQAAVPSRSTWRHGWRPACGEARRTTSFATAAICQSRRSRSSS